MSIQHKCNFATTCAFLIILFGLIPFISAAQQLKMPDFVLFSGAGGAGATVPLSPGYGVQMGSSSSVANGFIGSHNLVKSTGNTAIKASIYSRDSIALANSNTVSGKIAAGVAGTIVTTGNLLTIGSSAKISGSVNVNGHILVGGGTVSDSVIHPLNTTYAGPVPGKGEYKKTPYLPALPELPTPKDLTAYPTVISNIAATQTIKKTQVINGDSCGVYGNITFSGNKTLTLQGPGIYVFNSIKNTGTTNYFVFDFAGDKVRTFRILVRGDVDLGKAAASFKNGGDASRVYFEVQGKGTTSANGKTAFNIANGSSSSSTKWYGTVYAPYAAIIAGSGTGSSSITGALWSGTQVNLLSGVNITYTAYVGECAVPGVDAGPDKPYNFDGITTLSGTSTTPSATFKWTASPGGLITTPDNQATINVAAPGKYTFTVTAGGCTSTDTVQVSNKVKSVIGSELTSIYYNNPTGLPSPFFIITKVGDVGYVRIDVIVNVGNYDYVLNLLQQTAPINYGLVNIVTNGENGQDKKEIIITGDYPIANLLKLNDLATYINYCRPFYEAFSNSGLVNSAGDTTMRSNLVRNGYKITGDGVKVGIISNSFATITNGTTATLPLQPITAPPNPTPQTFITNTAAQDLTNGDLSPVTILQDYPIRSTDEGRAMAQIVHDVAPGAQLYFRTGYFTAGDFATGIKQLAAAGCKVIVDDLTYFTEPFLKDGVVAKAVDDVKAQGVTYFSSAGNFANKSYEKDFRPSSAATAGFSGKMAHNFSNTATDIFQHVTLAPGNYTIVLQWVDDIYSNGEIQGTHFDLDMFYRTYSGALPTPTEWKGFNRDNTDGDPMEIMPFIINTTTDADFLILNNNTDGNPVRCKYVIYRGDVVIMEYNEGTSTVVGQANAAGAIAVGASRYDKAPPYLTAPLIESFSSIGGTKTEGVVRYKPDIVGPDGVNTTVKMGQDYPNNALDGYSNFFGTSAAAPHAAAVAALIMQGKKKFLNQDPTLATPDEIRSLLQLTAVDMETASNLPSTKFDYISGYGLVDADSAMRTFAAPTATLIELVVPPSVIPCSGTPFTVTITGENFSRNTVVYLIKGPGDSTIIIPTYINSGAVSITINSCIGNPEFKAYTPPKSGTNGKDGGFSNSKYFFSAYVTVEAVSINKKYGETLAALNTIIRVNGKLLQDTTLTLQDIGLADMTVTSAATSISDVGTYAINLSRVFDPNNITDAAFLKSYNYKFTDGTVTIAKMPLRVTPDNKTITYGQNIGRITFKYDFDRSNMLDPGAIETIIRNYHEAYLPSNALAVIKDFKKPQINGSILDTTKLRNMNMVASFNAVNNSRKFTLSGNNTLIPITDASLLQNNLNVQYLVDIASESIYNYSLDPSTAKFFSSYPGIHSRALLSAASLASDDNTSGLIQLPGTTLTAKVLSGTLAQTVSSTTGPVVPIVDGSLVQITDAELTNPASTDLAQYINGTWFVLISDASGTISFNKVVNQILRGANGLIIAVDGTGNSLVSLPGGTTSPILTNAILRGANGSEILVTVNSSGVEVPVLDGSLIEMDNGDLVQFNIGTFSFNVISNGIILRGANGAILRGANGAILRGPNGAILRGANGAILRGANGAILRGANGGILRGANGLALGADSPDNNTGVILDSDDATNDGTGYAWLGSMFGVNMITGLNAGKQYLVPGVLVDPNFDISYGLGEVNIVQATVTVTAENKTRRYGDNNPPLTYTYSGFVNNEDSVTSGIKGVSGTGIPSVSTAATQTSPEGNYDIVVSQGGLVSANYSFSFVKGTLTITSNPCLVTPNTATNFGSTANSNTPTSLWLNLTTKVSGQLLANGDYLLFKAGTVTFNNITSNPTVKNLAIPNGKIVADNSVSSPVTKYDAGSNTWITKVPLGFSSTSDIFVTGAIINSSNGFKKGNNASTSVKGIFYSNKFFKDQWTYASAAYQPQFSYAGIDGIGDAGVVAINGTYRAGTPLPVIANLVNGGSGGGGNNYTGSTASFNNFTACIISDPSYASRGMSGTSSNLQVAEQDIRVTESKGQIQVYPNPAFATIVLSYVPSQTGNSKIAIFTIDGKNVLEINNGVWQAGKQYVKSIDISGLLRGVYMIQVTEKDSVTNKRIIIGR